MSKKDSRPTGVNPDTVTAIRGFIASEITPSISKIGDAESLFERGVIDSMAIVRLHAFLEERFSIELPEEEFMPDNYETLEAIARMVGRAGKG